MSPSSKTIISVIIPVHQISRRSESLKQMLSAFCQQSLPSGCFEIIIINNSPEEQSFLNLVLDDFYKKLQLNCLIEETPGSYKARNQGVARAVGSILAFTDSDCIPDPFWLESGLAAIWKNGKHIIVAGRIKRIARTKKGNLIERHEKLFTLNQRRNVRGNFFGATANLIVHSEWFKIVGLFRGELFSGGDKDWCYRAQAGGAQLIYFPQVLVNHLVICSWKDLIMRYRRKAGGTASTQMSSFETIKLKDKTCTNSRKTSITKLLPLRLLLTRYIVLLIQWTEQKLCLLGKKPIRG